MPTNCEYPSTHPHSLILFTSHSPFPLQRPLHAHRSHTHTRSLVPCRYGSLNIGPYPVQAAPCVVGSTWSVSGFTPCTSCAAVTTCGGAKNVETDCTATTNTVCKAPCVAGTSWSATGFAPCSSCAAVTTCGGAKNVETDCTATTNTVCKALCDAGTSWSATGYAPCSSCLANATCGGAAGVETACTKTTDTVCKAPCVAGSTWSPSSYAPCTICSADTSCGGAAGVETACNTTTDTACKVPCVAGTSWSATGYAPWGTPCESCSTDATCAAGVKIACTPGSDVVCNGAVAPCVGGDSFSASGKAPCEACTDVSTCAAGVKQSCTTTTDTVCEVPCVAGATWSASGNAPCESCAAEATCGGAVRDGRREGVDTACTKTKNTVCKATCVAGSTFSTSGYAQCTICSANSTCGKVDGVETACTTTTDTVCKATCVAGSTFSTSGYAPCISCAADATCGGAEGVETACTTTTDTVCAAASSPCRDVCGVGTSELHTGGCNAAIPASCNNSSCFGAAMQNNTQCKECYQCLTDPQSQCGLTVCPKKCKERCKDDCEGNSSEEECKTCNTLAGCADCYECVVKVQKATARVTVAATKIAKCAVICPGRCVDPCDTLCVGDGLFTKKCRDCAKAQDAASSLGVSTPTKKCYSVPAIETSTTFQVQDNWCAAECNSSPPNCPADRCECVTTEEYETSPCELCLSCLQIHTVAPQGIAQVVPPTDDPPAVVDPACWTGVRMVNSPLSSSTTTYSGESGKQEDVLAVSSLSARVIVSEYVEHDR